MAQVRSIGPDNVGQRHAQFLPMYWDDLIEAGAALGGASDHGAPVRRSICASQSGTVSLSAGNCGQQELPRTPEGKLALIARWLDLDALLREAP